MREEEWHFGELWADGGRRIGNLVMKKDLTAADGCGMVILSDGGRWSLKSTTLLEVGSWSFSFF